MIILHMYVSISSLVTAIYMIHSLWNANHLKTSNETNQTSNKVVQMSNMNLYSCKDQHVRKF